VTSTTATKSPTSAKAATSSRERLLNAAADLFYREGVAVGVERICQAAGVSKRSMYQLFDSKDAMIAESLRRAGARTTTAYLTIDDDLAPRDRILTVFRRLEEAAARAGYHGCPFVSTAVELKDHEHEAVVVAADFKGRLTAFFADNARLAGVSDAAEMAEELTVVFDGCAVRAVMRAAPIDGLATRTASAVLDSYGLTA
jgi:AcrR family transcriptional regulator